MRLIHKIYFKLWVYVCRFYTFLRHPKLFNHTDILLEYSTFTQKLAQEQLRENQYYDDVSKRILIIVPFRDKWQLTEKCLDSLLQQSFMGHQVMIALVDNGSVEYETKSGVDRFVDRSTDDLRFCHLRYDLPFNFSSLNNLAVKDCRDFDPDLLFFVNNDIEFLESNSVAKFIDFFGRDLNHGAVGCTLLYPNHSIQHLFVSVGCKIVGAHPFKNSRYNPAEKWYQLPRPVGAVTGAALMMRNKDFTTIGGFDEELPSCYQDVDLCLKLQKNSKVNWVLPDVALIHHETQTRRPDPSWCEVNYMYLKWNQFLVRNPFLSSSLSRWSEEVCLTLGEKDFPWKKLV